MSNKPKIAKLHFITMDKSPLGDHIAQAEAFCYAGGTWVQFRSKAADYPWIRSQALGVQQICLKYGATFIVNDKVELAKEISADGVHVGLEDMPVSEARNILGSNAIIGATTNTIGDIKRIVTSKPDYFGLGPLRFTSSKEKLSPQLGFEGYEDILSEMHESNITIPVIAIGGVVPRDSPALQAAQVHGVAIASGISGAENPAEATKEYLGFL